MLQTDFSKDAEKTLERVLKKDPKFANQIYKSISELCKTPDKSTSKKLKGYDYYRIRLQNYRIIYKFDSKILYIVKIGKRDKIYKHLI